MHQASASATSLDTLLPSHDLHLASYSEAVWPRLDSLSKFHASASTSERRKDSGSLKATLARLQTQISSKPIPDGLQTPPADGMNAYAPQYTSYATRHDNPYSSAAKYPAPQPYSTTSHRISNHTGVVQTTQPYRRSHSPTDTKISFATQEENVRRKSIILPSLQIPASVNDSGGSLGEFAAQITCLFWFESISTLQIAEEWRHDLSPVKRLVHDAIPTLAFRKWVVTILSTTQVTPNVILLALLFIYRLKTLNPTVKGKAGSEYRLLTVALMLGNKFLDDNTYTNKTWAEVSGISVGEIHVMEVEFLSNMRYSLLASESQWHEWQAKLGKFSEFVENAAKAPTTLPSPISAPYSSLLPSPPTSMQSSPPSLTAYPPNSSAYNYSQQWTANYNPPLISTLPSMPDLAPEKILQSSGKKRSYDERVEEPPAKRLTRSGASQVQKTTTVVPPRHNVPRLPVPNLSIATSQTMNGYSQTLPILPPLNGRAMSSVYPTTPAWTAQPQMSLTPTNSGHPSNPHPMSNYGTPSRRHSPRSVHDMLSMNSSPISGNFPSHDLNSPSFFLQQRNSPYRPVRPPNTLLYPPTSASMHNFPTSSDQMHYQPLGKRNDYRSGIVPDFLDHPPYQHWPVLPQPNFHGTA